MIAPRNPLETSPGYAAEQSAHAELLRRQRIFQRDTQASRASSEQLSSILVPAENGEELEPLVCRMD